MPLIRQSSYRRSRLLPNGHFETIYPAVFRKVKGAVYERERFTTSDGDFLDLDWMEGSNRRLLVLTHGLEGSTDRHYMQGMARIFFKNKWDVLAWNCRSCSGEINRSQRMYHHGEISDLGEVIQHAQDTKNYETAVLIGFSMGGNISMKYLGVHGREKLGLVKACVAFSSPTDIEAGANILDLPSNAIYRRRFLRLLKVKMEKKNEQYPGVVNLDNFQKIKTWQDFDEYFSAPLNGFRDAAEFYKQASAKNFMEGIAVPTLLVQAQNDPILPPECYPWELCKNHPHIFLETPKHGGHVGFWHPGREFAWSEVRALEFVNSIFKK